MQSCSAVLGETGETRAHAPHPTKPRSEAPSRPAPKVPASPSPAERAPVRLEWSAPGLAFLGVSRLERSVSALPPGLLSGRYGGAVGVTFPECGADSSGERSSTPSAAMTAAADNRAGRARLRLRSGRRRPGGVRHQAGGWEGRAGRKKEGDRGGDRGGGGHRGGAGTAGAGTGEEPGR